MNELFTSELFTTIMQILLPTLATAVGVVITAVAAKAVALINQKSEDAKETTAGKKLVKYINLLNGAVVDVVKKLNQTTVEGLKAAAADGKLTSEEITTIGKTARIDIITIIGPAGLAALRDAYGDLDALITAKIEAAVSDVKTAGKAA